MESGALGIYRGSGRSDPEAERARVRKEPLASYGRCASEAACPWWWRLEGGEPCVYFPAFQAWRMPTRAGQPPPPDLNQTPQHLPSLVLAALPMWSHLLCVWGPAWARASLRSQGTQATRLSRQQEPPGLPWSPPAPPCHCPALPTGTLEHLDSSMSPLRVSFSCAYLRNICQTHYGSRRLFGASGYTPRAASGLGQRDDEQDGKQIEMSVPRRDSGTRHTSKWCRAREPGAALRRVEGSPHQPPRRSVSVGRVLGFSCVLSALTGLHLPKHGWTQGTVSHSPERQAPRAKERNRPAPGVAPRAS